MASPSFPLSNTMKMQGKGNGEQSLILFIYGIACLGILKLALATNTGSQFSFVCSQDHVY